MHDVASSIDFDAQPKEQIFFSPYPEQTPSGKVCELIALSRGRVANRVLNGSPTAKSALEEWELTERARDTEFYEFYNVMWIEWEDGVAYRKAVGRVIKDAWDNMNPKPLM